MSALSKLIAALPKCRHAHEPARRFAFTVNNPSRDERKQLLRQLKKWGHYAIFQKEVSKTGTPHLQGYVEFRRDLDECLARQVLETPRMYIKPASANRESNKRYCTKTDCRVEGPWTVNNSKSHAKHVSKVRREAGRASGAKRKRLSAMQTALQIRRSERYWDKFEKSMLAAGCCPTCGHDLGEDSQ